MKASDASELNRLMDEEWRTRAMIKGQA